ncbi:MAG: RNA-binding S4 domain-containing protein [Pseudoxanthomonas sp.]
MQSIDFDLDREYVELNQLLKLTGVAASGGEGKAIVSEWMVTVDGQVELRRTAKIRAGQLVELDGVRIRVREIG